MRKKRGELLIILTAILALSVILTACGNGGGKGKDSVVQISLAQTGQTTCFDEEGDLIDCENTGQDGDLQKGVEWPDPRFTVGTGVEADCVTDNLTGLMWAKDGNLFGAVKGGETTWEEAMTYANDLTLCGYDDWALPNVNELASFTNYSSEISPKPWYTSQGFTNVQGCAYASSTTLASDPDVVFGLGSGVGAVHTRFRKDGTIRMVPDTGLYGFCIWPVRGGMAFAAPVDLPQTGQTTSYATNDDGDLQKGVEWPDPRFTVGTGVEADCVTDNLTGLMWTKDGNLSGRKTWQQSLDYANGLDICNYTDWRLPNTIELRSLTNYGEVDNTAWLNTQNFSNVQADFYWTSTTYKLRDTAWGVLMNEGTITIDETTDYNTKADAGNFVWPVRGGL